MPARYYLIPVAACPLYLLTGLLFTIAYPDDVESGRWTLAFNLIAIWVLVGVLHYTYHRGQLVGRTENASEHQDLTQSGSPTLGQGEHFRKSEQDA